MKEFGIIGYPLGHSYSAQYFSDKFSQGDICARYRMFPLKAIEEVVDLWAQVPFTGMNVTIPYKEAVIPYLDDLDDTAKSIGAVNVIQFKDGKRIGYNTDVMGFTESISTMLQPHDTHALILGTGGAAKAIRSGLMQLGIHTQYVSRKASDKAITYADLTKEIMQQYSIIVNCTPLGMWPNVDSCAAIPYELLSTKHLLFDCVYNPEETTFLRKGKEKGCRVRNGMRMLLGQAEAAWKIWNN